MAEPPGNSTLTAPPAFFKISAASTCLFLVSYLIYRYGEKSLILARKHIAIISVVLLVIIVLITIYYLT